MIETMDQSEGNVLGFRAVGNITKEDYATLTPAVEAAIKEYGSIRLLMDLTHFKWEKAEAWGSDFGFGKQFHESIERMALVGNASWEKHLTKFAAPYYAKEAKYFENDDDAWDWVKG